MLKETLDSIASKLRLHFYMQIFSNFEKREATLTTVETFSMEVIMTLKRPTVAQFAKATGISAPNAAYRVASLIKKGYIKKENSQTDKRTYYLVPTRKYLRYKLYDEKYLQAVADRVKERFSEDDYNRLTEYLTIIDKELMPELDFINKN